MAYAYSGGDTELETKLAGFVREYVQSRSAGGVEEQEEALRWVCAGFEWLLGARLQQRYFIDGIEPATDMLPDAINIVSPSELNIRGWALWYQSSKEGQSWIEPFFGSVRLADSADAIVEYELKFGDSVRGIGGFPFGKHIRRPTWLFPDKWQFEFSKCAVPAK